MPNFDCEKVELGRLSKSDDSPVLVGEASTLGWPVGRWPVYVTVDVEVPGLGRRCTRLFGPREAIVHHGNAVGYKYPQTNQTLDPVCEVHILND